MNKYKISVQTLFFDQMLKLFNIQVLDARIPSVEDNLLQ